VKPRSPEELELMRKSGEMSAKALKNVIKAVKSGVTLAELEKVVADTIEGLGGTSSFKTVPGYHWYTCININEEVVHGIPREIVLKKGDKVSIDLGALYKGWHTDTAWSLIVDEEPSKFLRVGEEALWKGIKNAVAGKRVGDISHAIQETIEGSGYEVVRSLVGHGVGKELHEGPEIPGFGKAGTGPVLQEGMTIAIEAIYTESTQDVVLAEDGWTIASSDGSLGGLFEMSVIVGKNEAEVITDWRKV
jgi:methionyl aminopeptidase